MQTTQVGIDAWLRWLGIVGYLASFSLAVMWASLGMVMLSKVRQRRLTWSMGTLAMVGYAAIFTNLVLIAMEPSWLNRVHLTLVQRSLSVMAAACGWTFTALYLRDEHRLGHKEQA